MQLNRKLYIDVPVQLQLIPIGVTWAPVSLRKNAGPGTTSHSNILELRSRDVSVTPSNASPGIDVMRLLK